MKENVFWIMFILVVYGIGFITGWLSFEKYGEPITIENTMMMYNYGKPLTEYNHTIREVVYDIDVDNDGKYDATFKWIKDNK